MTKTKAPLATAEEEITRALSALEEGWNRHDLAAACADFAGDADFVSAAGRWWRGRTEIVRQLEAFGDTTLQIASVSIRFLTFDVAVVHLTWRLQGKDAPPRRGILTLTTSRQKGRWTFDAAQNTEISDGTPEPL